ncbi:MAG: transcription termination/antitermination protein NusG [Deltaproteobacteria bacterium]|nr:transcription termination/antitermination protein NusG [Deltaproteobacteria bacterium]
MDSEKKWYIIHTYSGYERKVAESLMNRIQAYDLGDCIGQILIPTEDVVEMKSGKKVVTTKLTFPGYILVEMDMTDKAWHVVRGTPKVTGFISTGKKPTPLTEQEINEVVNRVSVMADQPKPKFTFDRGDAVKIIDGPFTNFDGIVDEVKPEKGKLRVIVSIFGRSTPVELDFIQVVEQ